MSGFLAMTVNALPMCLPLENVARVVPLSRLRAIPDAPPWFVGFLELAGEFVPVVDLALRLSLGEPPPYRLATPMVVVTTASEQMALIVEEVLGVRGVAGESVTHAGLFPPGAPPFQGMIRFPDIGPVPILHPARLLEMDLSVLQPVAPDAMRDFLNAAGMEA
ncbi:MAG: chemotaxis protein CheW [Magnetococcales bacterium]|nr:chemotaxis protein CheW [Magnetococcales bacterium]